MGISAHKVIATALVPKWASVKLPQPVDLRNATKILKMLDESGYEVVHKLPPVNPWDHLLDIPLREDRK